MAPQARGLQNFISDLRNAKSKIEETHRIEIELANIRKKFAITGNNAGEDGSNPGLSSHQRKKYVWKLVYIYVLGYDVDFGHPEVIALVRSGKYAEKHVGYTALSLLLKGDDPQINSIVPTIRKDLTSLGNGKNGAPAGDAAQSLALCSIANMSGLELVQALHGEVQHILVSKSSTPNVKKKAALCLLRLVRASPNVVAGREFAPRMAQLLQSRHLGVLTSAMSLLNGLASHHTAEYESLIPYVVHILGMLVLKKACAGEYLYYRTPSPWLQIKLLEFLQLYPNAINQIETRSAGPVNQSYVSQLKGVISKILSETDVSDSINKSNADHAILFEAVNLIVAWGSAGPAQFRDGAMKLLGKFISVREPNIRYLGLMTMTKLAQLDENSENIKRHQATVLVSLKDADISVRRRALDLLFVMCDTDNAEKIVNELVQHLALADAAIREEMVVKIAILAEKHATDLRWYVDTILRLISVSGDHVSDAIWHRVVRIVTNHPEGDLQAYAAKTLLEAVSPRRCHETSVRVAGYVLGEFGFLIAESPGMSGEEQFRTLHQHWPTSDAQTRAILVSTYAKLSNLYEECRPLVTAVFARCKNNVDVEIQQRAAEYDSMRLTFSPEAVEDLLREMPPFEAGEGLPQSSPPNEGSGEENDGGAGASDEATVGIPMAVIPAMRKAFSNLCTANIGVLFENDLLQVGVKHEYSQAKGEISVFFGNVSSRSPLFHFRVAVDEEEHLTMQKQGTPGILDEDDNGGCAVAVRAQAKLLLKVEVTAPFNDAPAMRVIFFTSDGTRHEYPLRLPVVATRFMEPVTLETSAFMQRWRSLEGENRECQEIIKGPPSSPPIDEEYMNRVANILTQGLNFGRCPGCDPTPWTVSGAATLRTAARDINGNHVNVGCLIRVEANPQARAFRITVRTLHPLCSQAVKNVAVVSIKLL